MLDEVLATLRDNFPSLYDDRKEKPYRLVFVMEEDNLTIDIPSSRFMHGELARTGYVTIPSRYHGKQVMKAEDIGLQASWRHPFANRAVASDDELIMQMTETQFLLLLFAQETGAAPKGENTPEMMQEFVLETVVQSPLKSSWTKLLRRLEDAKQPPAGRKTADQIALEQAQQRMFWIIPTNSSQAQIQEEEIEIPAFIQNAPLMPSFAVMRALLATLYSDQGSSRLVVADAQLDAAQVQFSDKATNNWHNILTEAKRQNKLQNILAVAYRDYSHQIVKLFS